MRVSCRCDDAEVSLHCWLHGLLPMFDCWENPQTLVFLTVSTDVQSLVHILVDIEGGVQTLSLLLF